MSVPLWKYLSIRKDIYGTILVDERCLETIQKKYKEINGDDNDEDECIKKLIKQFELIEDEFCLDCLKVCVSESSLEDAIIEVKHKVNEYNEILSDQIPSDEIIQSSSNSIQQIYKPVEEQHATSLDQIICIIHQKSMKTEVNDFLKEFLFQNIKSDELTIEPICDNATHPLSPNCMLDLFIRRLIKDRGTIINPKTRTKHRLVEPISLTDEFESWTFDHFHGLFDFWLVRDVKSSVSFPNFWTLNPNAQIDYMISNKLIDDTDDSSIKHIERPNTKSLDSFIRDICKIEDNGMFMSWYNTLTTGENITTFAHLTNLNQKDWERISRLPMNVIKTIKFYVDQEKQMIEQRKSKQTSDNNCHSMETTSYSKAEIRANLHMIKLFFHRQLEDIEGIQTIPRLDSYCVKQAFDEMRQEGYEDDGLFDQMKLFFQPLTVTDKELVIDENDLSNLDDDDVQEKKCLDGEINDFKESFEIINKQRIELIEDIEKIEKQRRENYDNNEKELENKSNEQRNQLNKNWSKEEDRLKAEMNSKKEHLKKLEEQLQDIESKRMSSEQLLEIIQKNLLSTDKIIDRRLVRPHRGFIMYGPPGTGKSVIMSKLAKKIGIAMLGPPLAAGELERPLVGQSEAIILDLCMRGNRLPHLMCCVSIDEIDSLAPKRDQDSSEGKVAKLSVLLSVIEGIKDVPNLMFFSATNRLQMMDEAFLRRMSGKFFVGRPSTIARRRILDGIPKMILEARIKEKLATATTNFSGAALKSLTSAITVDYIAEKRSNTNFQITEEQTLILADRTARQYQLYLGIDTLPRLLLNNLDAQRQLSNRNSPKNFHLSDKNRFTGKIIVSLQHRSVRIEIIHEITNKRHIIEDKFVETEENLQQLLERLTSYGNDRNVQLIQLIDLNLLSSQSAYDEKKIFETLKERYDECMEYKRSMIIYDLDSLIGVSKNESESSMGTSVSSSISHQNIYTYVMNRFREAKIELSHENESMPIERWAIAVVRDPFLLKKFTADVDFTLTDKQIEEEEEEYQRSTNVLICVKCREYYIESENKMGACNYHDGFAYDNIVLDANRYTASEVIDILTHEECIACSDPTKKDELDRKKQRFKYICCHATFQIGGGYHGCRKDKHGYDKININQQTDKHGYGKININQQTDKHGYDRINIKQQTDKTEEQLITEWETACKNNTRYNQRLTKLIEKRCNQLVVK